MTDKETTAADEVLERAVADRIAAIKAEEAARLLAESEADAAHLKLRKEALLDQKEVAYYEVLVNSYVGSAMELDKSLLTLASGAIAFSLTLVEPVRSSELMVFFYFSSIFLFLITIFSALLALKLNLAYVTDTVKGRPTTGVLMRIFDRSALVSFSIGVLLLAIVGAVSVQKKGSNEMTDQKKTVNVERVNKSIDGLADLTSGRRMVIESIDGLADLYTPATRMVAAPSTLKPIAAPSETQSPGSGSGAGPLDDLKPRG